MSWWRVTREELNKLRLWLGLATFLLVGSLALFMGGAMYFWDEVMMVFSVFFESLEEVAEQVFVDTHPLEGALYLFVNNLTASLITMALGPVLLFTLLSLLVNGGVIGIVGAIYVVEDLGFPLFLVGILPHGILEIPALLISGALGLRLGIHLLAPPVGESRWKALKRNYGSAFRLLPLVVILLVAAALIEVLVTPNLMELFYPEGVKLDW